MYLHFTPRIFQLLFPGLLWHMPRASKTIYLTFDDGPIPEVTPQVLKILATWKANATFFCVGDNVRKHPDVLRQVLAAGHRLGNHTFHHLNGLKTADETYLEDVALCQQELKPFAAPAKQALFRPPYGRIGRKQRRSLLQDYKIVMWDVLSADFDAKLSAEKCLRKTIYYTRPGSVVVFHDSLKAWERLQWVLPRYLEHFSSRGFTFATL